MYIFPGAFNINLVNPFILFWHSDYELSSKTQKPFFTLKERSKWQIEDRSTKHEARSTQISTEARSTQNSKTKHSKTKHPKLETTVGWITTILRLAWRNPNQVEAADVFAPPKVDKIHPKVL